MPELPEVEITCRGISPCLLGATIRSADIRESRLRCIIPDDFKQNILTQRIISVCRRAKYLIIGLEHGNILIHLGMSGHLKILTHSIPPQKHDHVDITLDNDYLLRYNDPRRFGLIQFHPSEINSHPLLQHLGPEPFSEDFNSAYLHHQATRRTIAVKNFIMDNTVVVGVGNIYASESLFLAGIRPHTPANQIPQNDFEKLVVAIKKILLKAIEQGGTTLKDFYQSDGRPGYFAQMLNVYGRAGKPCFTCHSPIDSIIIGQRNSYYCPHCQA